jgi:hypothetical protein
MCVIHHTAVTHAAVTPFPAIPSAPAPHRVMTFAAIGGDVLGRDQQPPASVFSPKRAMTRSPNRVDARTSSSRSPTPITCSSSTRPPRAAPSCSACSSASPATSRPARRARGQRSRRERRGREGLAAGHSGRRSWSLLWPAEREEPRAFNSGDRFRGTVTGRSTVPAVHQRGRDQSRWSWP